MQKLFYFILFYTCVFSLKSYSQQTFTLNLAEELDKLKPNVVFLDFIPIDSILNNKKKINKKIEKEFIQIQKKIKKGYYYLIKIGFYNIDSNHKQTNLIAFNEIKKYLAAIKSKTVIKIDYNCQNSLSIYNEALEYEKITKQILPAAILVSMYKSKRKIERLNHKKQCYF